MAEIQFGVPRRTQSRTGRYVLIVALFCAGGVLYKWNDLKVQWARWNYKPPPPVVVREDQVRLWVAARPIPAYSRIDPSWIRWDPISKNAVDGKDYLLEPRDIAQRVPLVDIEPDSPFRESMFAPKGTRPGIAAGVPAGWVALTFSEGELDGQLFDLKTGDSVALLSIASNQQTTWISEKARVLRPLSDRKTIASVPGKSNPLTGGGGGTTQRVNTVKELILAVPGENIVRLSQAQSQQSKIQVLLLSGWKDGSSLSAEAISSASNSTKSSVELIEGDRRSIVDPLSKSAGSRPSRSEPRQGK